MWNLQSPSWDVFAGEHLQKSNLSVTTEIPYREAIDFAGLNNFICCIHSGKGLFLQQSHLLLFAISHHMSLSDASKAEPLRLGKFFSSFDIHAYIEFTGF